MAAFEDRYRMGVSLTMINQERIARNIPRYRHSEDHYKMLGDISIAEAGKRKVSEAWLNRRPPYTKKQIAGFKMLNKWGRA